MFIHLCYAGREEVLLFDETLVYSADVIQKMSHLFPKGGVLYNEHGRRMKHWDTLDKGRVYILKRRIPRHRTISSL